MKTLAHTQLFEGMENDHKQAETGQTLAVKCRYFERSPYLWDYSASRDLPKHPNKQNPPKSTT